MNVDEFKEEALLQIAEFKRAHNESQAVEGESLYPAEMEESDWWEAFEKYRYHVRF